MKNYSDLLSIIVPVYNVELYIEECLLSIINQVGINMEIIVVNDGSTDNSPKIVEDLTYQYPFIHLYHKPNGGLSDARNYGLDIAQGDFITFIDSDDVLLGNDIYFQALDHFLKDENLDIIQFDVIHQWKSTSEHKREYPFKTYVGKEEMAKGYLSGHIHVACWDKIFRRSIFENIRFPLRQISEDIAIIPQILECAHQIRTTNIGYYGYRYREGSITTSGYSKTKTLSILNSYFKYLSYTYRLKGISKLSIQQYTRTFWNYGSIIRKESPDDLSEFLKRKFFIRISLFEYYSLFPVNGDMGNTLKTFILCVLGPRWMILFQRIFTH